MSPDAQQQTQEATKESKPWLFQPGNRANPGGRPKGSRNKLQGDFMRALADDFEANGKDAIVLCRETDVSTYLRICASLMPKEVEISRPLDDFSDDELRAAVATLRAIGAAQDAGSGINTAGIVQSAQSLQAVPEAG